MSNGQKGTEEPKKENKDVVTVEGTLGIYKKYNLVGRKLTQKEIDLIVARFRRERNSN